MANGNPSLSQIVSDLQAVLALVDEISSCGPQSELASQITSSLNLALDLQTFCNSVST